MPDAAWHACARRIDAFLPVELWPQWVRGLAFGRRTCVMRERRTLVCFLMGNGVSGPDVRCFLRPVLRDASAVRHVDALVRDIDSKAYDARWTYYNVNERDVLHLNNRPCPEMAGRFEFERKVNSFGRYAARRSVTLAQERAFMRQSDCLDARAFFDA